MASTGSSRSCALHTSGYLKRLGFRYQPATPARSYRHPSSLGLRV